MNLEDNKTQDKPKRTKARSNKTKMDMDQSQLQGYFLNRLAQYLDLKALTADNSSLESWQINALKKATYSAFIDCEKQGALKQAVTLLRQKYPLDKPGSKPPPDNKHQV